MLKEDVREKLLEVVNKVLNLNLGIEFMEDFFNVYNKLVAPVDNKLETMVEGLIANKKYREAYNLCLAAVRKNESRDYAMQKMEMLVPKLKEQSRKDKIKQWIVAIILLVVSFIILIL